GMAEHVGRERLPDYFRLVHRALKPDGVLLNQAIGESVVARPDNRNGSFIEQYVFPDGDVPPLPIMLGAAESSGFEIRDVESFRELTVFWPLLYSPPRFLLLKIFRAKNFKSCLRLRSF